MQKLFSLLSTWLLLLIIAGCSSSKDGIEEDRVLRGHIVDIESRSVYPGEIKISDGVIADIVRLDNVDDNAPYFLPGFVDSHIHIESSMLTPENFARIAVAHGTVAVVADPHEIVNVLGEEGLDFMIGNAAAARLHFHFGLPSCVPSSPLESAGAVIDAAATERLLHKPGIYFLAEMMNYPGVLGNDTEVMAKIEAARRLGMPVDGHAPGLLDADLDRYIAAGISTDHECSTLEEARQRIDKGMKVIVREGSSARNFDALALAITYSPAMTMLCSDDKHPDDLIEGHIDGMVRQGLTKGIDVWNLLTAACTTPVRHYNLPTGQLNKGDAATFISVNNLRDMKVTATYIDGIKVYDHIAGLSEQALSSGIKADTGIPNNFKAEKISQSDIAIDLNGAKEARVIVASDGQLLTEGKTVEVSRLDSRAIQKIVVYNRYGNGLPQVAFIEGFNLQRGAIAATIAHDSHNIVAIGQNDDDIVKAINALIDARGGVIAVDGDDMALLPLPVAGLMSTERGEVVAAHYLELLAKAKSLGCTMRSPYITMSFMALPVIPALKLTDKGLVDVNRFDFTDLLIN